MVAVCHWCASYKQENDIVVNTDNNFCSQLPGKSTKSVLLTSKEESRDLKRIMLLSAKTLIKLLHTIKQIYIKTIT